MKLNLLAPGGDGIGPEVVDASLKLLDVTGKLWRENSFEGMRSFLQTISVWLATDPQQADPFPAA